MKERKKLKEIYSQHKDVIRFAIFAIAFFIGGYLFSWNFMKKTLDDRKFELCEQVARDVYAQRENVIVEVPEDFYVSMTTTTITVKWDDNLYRGKVIARLQNGELVIMRDMETGEAIFLSILMGILFVLMTILIVCCACKIYEKIKK